MAHSMECSSKVKTSFLSRSYVFCWSIENFPKRLATFKLTSHEFKPLSERFARIFSVSLEKQEHDYCVLTINSFPKGLNEYRIDTYHTITISDSTGKMFEHKTQAKSYGSNYDNSFSLQFSNKNLIEYSESAKNKTLVFNCLMEFEELATNVHLDQLTTSPSDILPDLLKDLKVLYADSVFTDLELLVQDDVVRVHKSVLNARSTVFAKLLASPIEEKNKDKIKIDDIELPILKAFIEFLYTGSMPDLEFESVCGLYYAADKYDVPSLQKACSSILVAQLDLENACDVLSLANRHSDEKLKDFTMEYMKFEFEAMVGSQSFTDFVKTETELAAELMKFCCKKFEKRGQSESA